MKIDDSFIFNMFGLARRPPERRPSDGPPRVALYLRVSTLSQVRTDYDPEGISIPAQRSACEARISQQLEGAVVVGEFIEPGKSATRLDKRPAFQELIQRIVTQQDVDYVMVYKLSRINRNWAENGLVFLTLRALGVKLMSATENIDDSAEGLMLMGILASVNGFQSDSSGEDIRFKMAEKAKKGGTLGRAPLGYINVREKVGDSMVAMVKPDPERAHLIRLAFELFATGDYSLQRLADTLTDHGLRTRPGRFPAGPISDSKLADMLRDRYYLGYVTYKGEERPGRHDPLVTPDLFERVQRVLEVRQVAGERQRVHGHHLRGSVFCGLCHDRGEVGRLVFQQARGRGGTYDYFFCRRRQERKCEGRYLSTDRIEEAIARYYGQLQLTSDFIATVRENVKAALDDANRSFNLRRQQLARELMRLERQEENLLDLAADGDLTSAKVRQRLNKINEQRAAAQAALGEVHEDLSTGAAVLEAGLKLLEDPECLYRQSDSEGRRLLNQAFFVALYVDEVDVTGDEVREPILGLVEAQRLVRATKKDRQPVAARPSETSTALLLRDVFYARGSNKAVVVEVKGFEPSASALRTLRSAN